MADNFNFKKYLLENKLGSYSKATSNEATDPYDPSIPDPSGHNPLAGRFEEGTSSALDSLNNLERALLNLKNNVATNSTIGTESKQGLLQAFEEMMEDVQTIANEIEGDDEPEYTSDYSRRRASEY